jgi:lipopolysaccharide biosynthesis glycosyltransferase
LNVYILDAGIRERSRKKLNWVAQLRSEVESELFWIKASDSPLLGLSSDSTHISPVTFLRLHATKWLPKEVSKFVYIDVDTVTTGNLAELFQVDMAESTIAAVQDWLLPFVSSSYRQSVFGRSPLPLYRDFGHDDKTPYFNAGLILVDRERWDAKDVTAKVLNYIQSVKTRYADQDGLNAILASDCRLLDPSWNVTPQLVGIESWPDQGYVQSIRLKAAAAISEKKLIHYVGARKPWLYPRACPLSEDYYKYERQVFPLLWERFRMRSKGVFLYLRNVKRWI